MAGAWATIFDGSNLVGGAETLRLGMPLDLVIREEPQAMVYPPTRRVVGARMHGVA